MAIATKRIYEAPSPRDGYRILVDLIWTRRASKAKAAVDLWLHEIKPLAYVLAWFNYDLAR